MRAMNEPLITKENVTTEFLTEILKDAYIDTALDDDGDLIAYDVCSVYIIPLHKNTLIQMVTLFNLAETASKKELLNSINAINGEYTIVRAWLNNHRQIAFEYDIILEVPITRKALVCAVRRFASIPYEILQKYDHLVS